MFYSILELYRVHTCNVFYTVLWTCLTHISYLVTISQYFLQNQTNTKSFFNRSRLSMTHLTAF